MSHANEGVLHAYLDGALDELLGAGAQATRDHIAGCSECAEALHEARAVRANAIAILGGTLPSVVMPPLEDLRARAAVSGAPLAAPRSRMFRVRWAASVVMALGAGWMLRGDRTEILGVMDAPTESAVSLPAFVVPAVPADVESRSASLVREATLNAEVGLSVVASTNLSEEAMLQAPSTSSALDRSVVAAVAEPISEEEPVFEDVMTDLPPRTGLREMTADVPLTFAAVDAVDAKPFGTSPPASEVLGGALEVSGEVSREVAGAERELVALAPMSTPVEENRSVEEGVRAQRAMPVSSAREATVGLALVDEPQGQGRNGRKRSDDGGAFLVPGLALISITNLGEGVIPLGAHVLQTLEDGQVLEMFHLLEGVDPNGLEPFPEDGKTGVITPREDGWLIMRANRSVEELKALIARLDGIS